tara:strand:- start:276 stop:512 length:237 start_codon:yes stop_codon:yes gene_type:complete
MKRGRPKGYSPYITIPYEELADFVGKKTLVKVCKKWIEELIEQTTEVEYEPIKIAQQPSQPPKEETKIEYKLTTFDND